MKKKIVSVLLATVLCASTVMAGCGKKEEAKESTTTTPDATVASTTEVTPESTVESVDPVEATKMEAPSTDGWTDADKIYFYSWNDEFGSRMQYVLDAYPEYSDYVEYVNLACSGTDGSYQTAIDNLIETNDAKFPSIIAADNDVAKYYGESDLTIAISDLGITDDMYANAYDYTKQYATYEGELKALTWQATPGCLVYRTDIAEEVLGSADRATVEAAVKDWDAFFETAEAMKEAGYKMTSGCDEIKYACFDQQTQPWITVDADGNETLTLDDSVTDFFTLSKKLYDGEYTNNGSMWDATWNADYEGDVFCYFGCTWSVYWCMAFDKDADGNPGVEGSTYGNWNVCEAPVAYHWGGTYVMVVDGCPNTELAAFLIYSLCCDEDIMYTLAVDTKDFVNNKAVIAKEIANGDGSDPILGGENPVEVWAESVKKIDLSNASYLDAPIKDSITKAATAYNAGEVDSEDAALEYVINDIKGTYSYLQ